MLRQLSLKCAASTRKVVVTPVATAAAAGPKAQRRTRKRQTTQHKTFSAAERHAQLLLRLQEAPLTAAEALQICLTDFAELHEPHVTRRLAAILVNNSPLLHPVCCVALMERLMRDGVGLLDVTASVGQRDWNFLTRNTPYAHCTAFSFVTSTTSGLHAELETVDTITPTAATTRAILCVSCALALVESVWAALIFLVRELNHFDGVQSLPSPSLSRSPSTLEIMDALTVSTTTHAFMLKHATALDRESFATTILAPLLRMSCTSDATVSTIDNSAEGLPADSPEAALRLHSARWFVWRHLESFASFAVGDDIRAIVTMTRERHQKCFVECVESLVRMVEQSVATPHDNKSFREAVRVSKLLLTSVAAHIAEMPSAPQNADIFMTLTSTVLCRLPFSVLRAVLVTDTAASDSFAREDTTRVLGMLRKTRSNLLLSHVSLPCGDTCSTGAPSVPRPAHAEDGWAVAASRFLALVTAERLRTYVVSEAWWRDMHDLLLLLLSASNDSSTSVQTSLQLRGQLLLCGLEWVASQVRRAESPPQRLPSLSQLFLAQWMEAWQLLCDADAPDVAETLAQRVVHLFADENDMKASRKLQNRLTHPDLVGTGRASRLPGALANLMLALKRCWAETTVALEGVATEEVFLTLYVLRRSHAATLASDDKLREDAVHRTAGDALCFPSPFWLELLRHQLQLLVRLRQAHGVQVPGENFRLPRHLLPNQELSRISFMGNAHAPMWLHFASGAAGFTEFASTTVTMNHTERKPTAVQLKQLRWNLNDDVMRDAVVHIVTRDLFPLWPSESLAIRGFLMRLLTSTASSETASAFYDQYYAAARLLYDCDSPWERLAGPLTPFVFTLYGAPVSEAAVISPLVVDVVSALRRHESVCDQRLSPNLSTAAATTSTTTTVPPVNRVAGSLGDGGLAVYTAVCGAQVEAHLERDYYVGWLRFMAAHQYAKVLSRLTISPTLTPRAATFPIDAGTETKQQMRRPSTTPFWLVSRDAATGAWDLTSLWGGTRVFARHFFDAYQLFCAEQSAVAQEEDQCRETPSVTVGSPESQVSVEEPPVAATSEAKRRRDAARLTRNPRRLFDELRRRGLKRMMAAPTGGSTATTLLVSSLTANDGHDDMDVQRMQSLVDEWGACLRGRHMMSGGHNDGRHLRATAAESNFCYSPVSASSPVSAKGSLWCDLSGEQCREALRCLLQLPPLSLAAVTDSASEGGVVAPLLLRLLDSEERRLTATPATCSADEAVLLGELVVWSAWCVLTTETVRLLWHLCCFTCGRLAAGFLSDCDGLARLHGYCAGGEYLNSTHAGNDDAAANDEAEKEVETLLAACEEDFFRLDELVVPDDGDQLTMAFDDNVLFCSASATLLAGIARYTAPDELTRTMLRDGGVRRRHAQLWPLLDQQRVRALAVNCVEAPELTAVYTSAQRD